MPLIQEAVKSQRLKMAQSIQITQLDNSTTEDYSSVFNAATDIDKIYFSPFDYTHHAFSNQIQKSTKDSYWGIYITTPTERIIAGFYMLRGLDEGYHSPMFGLYINSKYRSIGLGHLAIAHAIATCKLRQYPSLLLKVHQDNERAIRLYRSYKFQHTDTKQEQLVMELSFTVHAN